MFAPSVRVGFSRQRPRRNAPTGFPADVPGRLAYSRQRKIHRAALASHTPPAGNGAQGKRPTSGPAGGVTPPPPISRQETASRRPPPRKASSRRPASAGQQILPTGLLAAPL